MSRLFFNLFVASLIGLFSFVSSAHKPLYIEKKSDHCKSSLCHKLNLHQAVNEGWKGVTWGLIQNGADVNAKDKGGWTPLSIAINNNDLEMARLLIENWADVNAKDKGGWTPLSIAINNNDLEMARLLIENWAVEGR